MPLSSPDTAPTGVGIRSGIKEAGGARQRDDPPPRPTPALRVHLQGTFLLIMLLLAFWGLLRWAGPVISEALGGPDGAVVARAPIETEESGEAAGSRSERDARLDGDEVATLQAVLTRFGYSPGPADGILGDLTRAAADAAKADLNLQTASDRLLLETLTAAAESLDGAGRDPDS